MLLLSKKLYRISGKLVLQSCLATLSVISSSYIICRIGEARNVIFVWEWFKQHAQNQLLTLELSFTFTLLIMMRFYGFFCENWKVPPYQQLMKQRCSWYADTDNSHGNRRGDETYYIHLSTNSTHPKILRNLFEFKHLIWLFRIFNCGSRKHFRMSG